MPEVIDYSGSIPEHGREVRYLGRKLRRRPDLVGKNVENGVFEVPVEVLCEWMVDGEECYWPVDRRGGGHGMVWPTMDAWLREEEAFMKNMYIEIERLKEGKAV